MKPPPETTVTLHDDLLARPRQYFWMALLVAGGFIFLYAWVYFAQPFSGHINDLVVNLLTILPAILCTNFALLLRSSYQPGEILYKAWSRFSLGFGLWAFAELIWTIFNLTVGEVEIGLPDIFWILGYGSWISSILIQYNLVARPTGQGSKAFASMLRFWYLILVILAVLALINFFFPGETIPLLVNYFYPLGDLLLILAAIWLAHTFLGGAFAYPWMGLLLFAIADVFYAWLESSGLYAWSVENGNLLSGLADLLYIASYLAVVLGALMQWLVMRYAFVSDHRLQTG